MCSSDLWTLAIRAGGSERVLARYAAELGFGVTRTLDSVDEQKFWTEIQTLGQDSPVVLSLSVPPSDVARTITDIQRLASDHQLGFTAWGRVAVGSLLFTLDGGVAESFVTVVDLLRRTLPREASAVVTRCPAALKSSIDVWGTSPTHLGSMLAVKRALNPKDTLNRGRFLL